MRRPSPESSPPIDQPEQRFEQFHDLSSDPDTPSHHVRDLEGSMKNRISLRLREGQELTAEERAFLVGDLVRNRESSELGRMNFTRHGFKNACDAMRRLDIKQVTVMSGETDEEGNREIGRYDRGRENFWQRMPSWSRRMLTQGGVSGAITLGGLAIGGLVAGPAALVALGAWGGGLLGSGIVEAMRHRHLQRDTRNDRSLAYRSAQTMFQNLEDAVAIGSQLETAETDEARAEIINNVIKQIHANEIETLDRYRRLDSIYKVARVLASAAGAGLGGWATQAATIKQAILERGAEGIHDLDLDGDGVAHTVKRFTDGYHFQIKQEDILEAAQLQQQMGAEAAPFNVINEAGSGVSVPSAIGEEAIYHAGTLDVNLINGLIRDGILQETAKALYIATGASAGTALLQEIVGGLRNQLSRNDRLAHARIQELSPLATTPPAEDTSESEEERESDERRRERGSVETDDRPRQYDVIPDNADLFVPAEREIRTASGIERRWIAPPIPEADRLGQRSLVVAANQAERNEILQRFHDAYAEHRRSQPDQPFSVTITVDADETEEKGDGIIYYRMDYREPSSPRPSTSSGRESDEDGRSHVRSEQEEPSRRQPTENQTEDQQRQQNRPEVFYSDGIQFHTITDPVSGRRTTTGSITEDNVTVVATSRQDNRDPTLHNVSVQVRTPQNTEVSQLWNIRRSTAAVPAMLTQYIRHFLGEATGTREQATQKEDAAREEGPTNEVRETVDTRGRREMERRVDMTASVRLALEDYNTEANEIEMLRDNPELQDLANDWFERSQMNREEGQSAGQRFITRTQEIAEQLGIRRKETTVENRVERPTNLESFEAKAGDYVVVYNPERELFMLGVAQMISYGTSAESSRYRNITLRNSQTGFRMIFDFDEPAGSLYRLTDEEREQYILNPEETETELRLRLTGRETDDRAAEEELR